MRTLTASAARVNLNDRNSIKRFVSTRQGWQEEAWHYRRELGELRYATSYLGNSAMRMRLFPAAYLPGGATPQDAVHVPGLPPDLVQAASDTIGRLASGGPFALGMLLKKQTENFEVAGECYLVGQIDAFGIENWNVYSVSEITFDVGGRVGIRMIPGNGMSNDDVQWLNSSNSYITRLWWPDPQFGAMADSPVRAALGICYELQLLSLDVRATAKSRLANNGLMLVPEGLSIVGPNPADETTIEGDPFMRTLVEAASSALSDEGSAAAVLPLLIRGHPDALKELRHLPLDRAADAENAKKRQELLGRLATTIDLPAEILTGIADLNHWSAWQVDDNAFRHHIEPVVQVQIDALTAGFLWPMLNAYKRWPPELVRRVCIWYDPTELVTHPDRAVDAKDAFDRGAIGRAALREYLGMSALDKPDDLDEVLYVLGKAARVDPVLLTSVLKSLKQTSIPIPDADQLQAAQVAQTQEAAAQARQATAEARGALPPGQTAPPALEPGGDTGGPSGLDGIPSQPAPTAGPPDDMTRRIGNAKATIALRKAITAAADPEAPIADSTLPPGQEPEHAGAMIAVYPDEDSANNIALSGPDAEPAANLHVTMVYLPDFDPGQLDALNQAVDQFAAAQQPLSGKLGGKGQFNPSENSDGKPVTYASVDVPGLSEMQAGLQQHLQQAGFQLPDPTHGFVPHMTLRYGEQPGLDVPDTPLSFNHLSVVQEPTRTHFPLGTAPTPESIQAAANTARDSAKLAQLDRDLRARLQTAANSTMRRAFERAGAKVVSKSKTPAGRQLALAASISGVPTWEIPIRLGTGLLASLGIHDLINDETLSELHDAYNRFIQTGHDQALRLAARIAGLDVNTAFGMRDQLRSHQESGWEFLVQTMKLRAQELLHRMDPSDAKFEVETDLVPYGPVRATIAIAGGQPGGAFDPATGLPIDPTTIVGGVGNGIDIGAYIEASGAHIQRYIWHHGWASNPFEPHVRLDGTTFTDFADEKFRADPLPSGADFPHGGFYHPGDHPGCTCDFEVVWDRPAQPVDVSMVAGAWEEALHPRNKGKFARKAGPGEAKPLTEALGGKSKRDTPATKYGLRYKKGNAERSDVRQAQAFDGWDNLPTTDYQIPKDVNATEETLQSSSIDKVVSGRQPFREGYDPHILINQQGEHFVIDGHHRVAMHTALGHTSMPAKVLDLRGQSPLPKDLQPQPLDDKLVNYKPDRNLSDPSKTEPIADVLPGVGETTYSRMPFLDQLHEAAGIDPNGDVGQYMAGRKEFFNSLPEEDVPLKNLVVTQHVVNTDRVHEMRTQPETRGSGVPFFVKQGDKVYAVNGHHRIVQEALDGSATIKGRMWHAPQDPAEVAKQAKQAARQVATQAAANEPQITADLQSLARQHDAMLSGLDYRLKGRDSLERKIRDKATSKRITPDQYAGQIGDAVRYTALVDSANFGNQASSIVQGLQRRGYKVTEVQNLWAPKNIYRGVHLDIVAPSGQKAELQFHTPESLAVKQQIHPLYERARLPSTPDAEVRRLNREMLQAWSAIPQPSGAELLGRPMTRPALFSVLSSFD